MILFEIPYIKKRYEVNRLSLLIGALLPDFIDKPLELLEISSGRGFAHTLIFTIIIFIIIHLVTKQKSSISVPFLIGLLIHLLLDIENAPIFYPFFVPEVETVENPIEFWVEAIIIKPLIIITEIAGIIIIMFVMVNNKLYSIKEIVNYLKTRPHKTILETNKNYIPY